MDRGTGLVILHRGTETNGYWVDDYPIEVVPDYPGPGWRILLVDTLSAEHEQVREWQQRNRDILDQVYPRLTDARQALEALVDLDTVPMDPLFPASRLRRVGPGHHEATDDKGREFKIIRNGKMWNIIEQPGQELFARACSMWEVRIYLTAS